MALRTYYWERRNASLLKYYKNKFRHPERFYFRYGNAGDMFNADLINYLYKTEPINILEEGNRLLLIGSIMNHLKEGDIVNGIGWKGNDVSHLSSEIASSKVFGVRGPLTKSLFEKYNADISELKFEYDPGLLIKEVYNIDLKKSEDKYVSFVPHFRDELVYKGKYPKNINVIKIDDKPFNIAKKILKSKIVYASSLHGIIFSHALNKPCIFVAPQSEEPIFKYEDYYLSINKDLPQPVKDIYSVNFKKDKATSLDREITINDFYFPSVEELKKKGIIF